MLPVAGLLTFVSALGDGAAHREAITAALPSLQHRFPDQDGAPMSLDTADVAFTASTVLAYPLSGVGTRRYLIAYAGALYNAGELRDDLGLTFATDSDAEVIAAAYHHWGPSAVGRLRGAFAFVIWDSAARRAFGARDQFGIAPLYHLATPEGVYFASEKKALLGLLDQPELDEANLQHYFTLQYVPEPGTLHKGIARLGAGESFVYTPGGPVANRRYAQLAFRPSSTTLDAILGALRDSVHAHVPAGRPVGAFLSSGVDSAAVVALAREAAPGLRAYTVGYGAEGASELEVAEQTARALEVPLSPAIVTADEVIRELPRMMWHLDDPVADATVIPIWFAARAAARDEITVALSGDGADELFGGYAIYREPLSLSSVAHLPGTMQRGLRAVSRVIPQGVKGKGFIERGTTPLTERYYGTARVFTEEDKARLLRRYDPAVRYTDVTAPVYAEAAGLDEVATMQHVDLYTGLRGAVLVKADRMAMAHSVELRTPYLDRKVFDVAARLPAELKVPHRSPETKAALREAVVSIVPEAIVHRRVAFPAPIRPWLRRDMYDWAHDLLARSGTDELLDLDLVRGLLDAHRKKDGDHARQVWAVLMFCLWHAIFVAGSVVPDVDVLRDRGSGRV
jgi:asparagine synthase (glutamine-hydrolysing)